MKRGSDQTCQTGQPANRANSDLHEALATCMELESFHNLFLMCLQEEPSDEAGLDLAQLSQSQWSQLLELATQQRVAPLLYQKLKARGWESRIPPSCGERWHNIYRSSATRNLKLYHELGLVLSTLRWRDIPVIVLKGAFLAAAVYPKPVLRLMSDIDILVPRADAERALGALSALGYSSGNPFTPAEHLADGYHFPPLAKPGVVAGIELHWGLTAPGRFKASDLNRALHDDLWDRAVPTILSGSPTLGLCPEDLLLHLCGHLTHHHVDTLFEQGISPLCDIDQVVRRYQNALDWEQVHQRALAWGWGRGVHLALYLAVKLLKAPVPPEALCKLQPAGFDSRIGSEASVHLFEHKEKLPHYLARFWNATSTQAQAKYLRSRLLPTRQEMAQLHHTRATSSKLYIYYFLRIKYFLQRDGAMVWRVWRGHPQERSLVQRRILLTNWLDGTDL